MLATGLTRVLDDVMVDDHDDDSKRTLNESVLFSAEAVSEQFMILCSYFCFFTITFSRAWMAFCLLLLPCHLDTSLSEALLVAFTLRCTTSVS